MSSWSTASVQGDSVLLNGSHWWPWLLPMGLEILVAIHSTISFIDSESIKTSLPLYSMSSPKPKIFFLATLFSLCLCSPPFHSHSCCAIAIHAGASPMCRFLHYVWRFWLFVSLRFLLLSSIEFQWVPLVTYLAEEQSFCFLNLELRNCWGNVPIP